MRGKSDKQVEWYVVLTFTAIREQKRDQDGTGSKRDREGERS